MLYQSVFGIPYFCLAVISVLLAGQTRIGLKGGLMMTAEDSSADKSTALARNLRELRNNRRLRQEDVAKALGVATPTYSSWERGRAEPDASTLLELSRFFDVTVDRLLHSEPCPLAIGRWYLPVGRLYPTENPAGISSRRYTLGLDPLYYYDTPDDGGSGIELIDSWRFVKNEGERSYTLYLHHDVKFHSGDPLELEDVKLSYDLFFYRYPFYRQFISNVEVREEEHAVRLNLSEFLEFDLLPIPYIIPRS